MWYWLAGVFWGIYYLAGFLEKNLLETRLSEVILLLGFWGVISFCVFLSLSLLFKDRHKGALGSFVFAVMFFGFGALFHHQRGLIVSVLPLSLLNFICGYYRYLRLVWIMIIVRLIYSIKYLKNTKRMVRLCFYTSLVLSTIGVLFLLPSVYKIYNANKEFTENTSIEINASLPLGYKPDIYYIILDMYAREDILKSLFEFDNAVFIDWLRRKGFCVADQSCSNYPITELSIPSTLDMNYLETNNITSLNVWNNAFVVQFLKKQGYHFINISSNEHFSARIFSCDEEKAHVYFGSFTRFVFSRLTLAPFFHNFDFFHKQTAVKEQFTALRNSKCRNKPLFVFCHILAPHDPATFSVNGEKHKRYSSMETEAIHKKQTRIDYVNDIKVINRLLQECIEKILSNSSNKPVIIVQSDHGPHFIGRSYYIEKKQFKINNIEDQIIKERMSNLFALYLPSSFTDFPSQISNVNTFRVIFNNCFATHFTMLNDQCYLKGKSPIRSIPYNISKVNQIEDISLTNLLQSII